MRPFVLVLANLFAGAAAGWGCLQAAYAYIGRDCGAADRWRPAVCRIGYALALEAALAALGDLSALAILPVALPLLALAAARLGWALGTMPSTARTRARLQGAAGLALLAVATAHLPGTTALAVLGLPLALGVGLLVWYDTYRQRHVDPGLPAPARRHTERVHARAMPPGHREFA